MDTDFTPGQAVLVRYSQGPKWERATYVSHEGPNRHTVTLATGATGYNVQDVNIKEVKPNV